MAYNFTGDDLTAWLKSSLQAYSYLSGSRQYVGRLQPQVTVSPMLDNIEWWDNTSGVQSLYVLDITKADFQMKFAFMQVLDPNALAVAMNGTIDTSDPLNTKVYFGSQPPTLVSAKWEFVGIGRTKRPITLTVLNAVISKPESINMGTPAQFSSIPITLRALQDPNVSDKARNIAYFTIGALANS